MANNNKIIATQINGANPTTNPTVLIIKINKITKIIAIKTISKQNLIMKNKNGKHNLKINKKAHHTVFKIVNTNKITATNPKQTIIIPSKINITKKLSSSKITRKIINNPSTLIPKLIPQRYQHNSSNSTKMAKPIATISKADLIKSTYEYRMR